MKKHIPLTAACLIASTTLFAADYTASPSAPLRDPMPEEWSMLPQNLQSMPTEDNWWQSLGDTTLVALIDMGERNNFNVLAAARRIEAARQTLNQAKAAYFPTLDVNAGWTKGQSSGREGAVATPSAGYDYFSLGLSMQWEIDVFGKITSQVKAQKQNYNATRAEYAAVMVTLASNIAKAYINLRLYQEQLDVALAHIEQQKHVTDITKARFETGLGNQLEVDQSRIVLLSTEATIPDLESMIESSINAIALLTGEYPDKIRPMLTGKASLPEVSSPFGLGVPMDLLRRRPDIVEAELQMAQYAAMAGIAKKDFLPTLSLTGSIGTSSHRADNLFGSHSLAYSVAPQLSWTLFDGLARNYRVAEAKANLQASVDSYNLTVMTAVQEVNNAIIGYESAVRTIELYQKVMEASQEAVNLSLARYKQGLSDFTNVADAQMNYLTYQNSLVSAKGKAVTALVTLYDALGGGWDGVLPEIKNR